MNILYYLLCLVFCLTSLIIGFILIRNPAGAIEIQRKFYAGINWNITPIDLKKELRNTRLMGLLLICLVIAAILILLATV